MAHNRNYAITTAQVINAATTIALPDMLQADRMAITFDVTAASGTTPSMTPVLEGLDAISGKWFTIRAFAAKTAVGTETIFVGAPNDSVFPVVKMRINIPAVTGTTPSFTVTIGANSRSE